MIPSPRLPLSCLTTAVMLALGSVAAHAAPAANTLPGAFNTNKALGVSYVSTASNAATINVPGDTTVLQWGGSTSAVTTAVAAPAGMTTAAGFNVGAGATLTVNGAAPGSVLALDLSGQASNVFGTVSMAGVAQDLFIANPNGVVVGSSGKIVDPSAVALIGYAQDPAVFAGGIAIDNSTVTSKGDVTVAAGASINAGYLLVAGAGKVNVDVAHVTAGTALANLGIAAGVGATMNAHAAPTVLGTDVYTTTAVLNLSSAAAGGTDLTAAAVGAAGALDVASGTTLTLGSTASGHNVTVGGLLSNAGTLTLNNGQLALGGGLNNSGTLTANGLDSIGGDLINSGSMTLATVHTVTVGGALSNSGKLSATSVVGFDVTGAFTNSATLNAGSATTVAATGGITNSGMLTLGANAKLDTGTQAPAAIVNSGQIDAAGLYVGELASVASFTNTGVLNLGSTDASLYVSAGTINLGGVVQAGQGTAAIGAATLYATNGDLTVNAALSTASNVSDTFSATKGSVLLNAGVSAVGGLTAVAANQVMVNGAVTATNGVTLQTTNTWTGPYNLGVVIGSSGSISANGIYITLASAANNAGNLLQYGALNTTSTFSFTGGSYYQGSGATIGAATADFYYHGVIAGGIAGSGQGGDPYRNGVVIVGSGGNLTLFLDPLSAGLANQNTNILGVGNVDLSAYLNGFIPGHMNVELPLHQLLLIGSSAVHPIVSGESVVANSAFVPSNLFIRAQGGNLTLQGNATTKAGNDTFYWPGLTYLSTVKSGMLATVDANASISVVDYGTPYADAAAYVSNALPMQTVGGEGLYLMSGSIPLNVTTNSNSVVVVPQPVLSGIAGTQSGALVGTVLTYDQVLPAVSLVPGVTPSE